MLLKKSTIGHRLFVAFGLLVLFTVAVGGAAIYQLNEISKLADKMYHHPFTVSNSVRDIKTNIIAIHRSMKDIALARDLDEIGDEAGVITRLEKETLLYFNRILKAFLGDPEDVSRARMAFVAWKPIRDRVLFMRRLGKTEEAAELTKTVVAVYMDDLNAKVQVMSDFAENKAVEFLENAHTAEKNALWMMGFLIGATLFISVFVAVSITRGITGPINHLNRVADNIAHGRNVGPQEVRRQDETGRLIASINAIISANDKIVTQARAISAGDYDSEIELRSKEDQLGKAIAKMTASLRQSRDDNQRQNWFKNGQAGLNDCLRSDKSVADLCREIISFLSKYLNAHVGAVYTRSVDDRMQLTGSYAFTVRKQVSSQYRLGEGLVGQAALENEPILITEPPVDYIQIASGLGHTPPRQIVVFPFRFEGQVEGVLELGFSEPMGDTVLVFLKQVSESIGIAVNSAKARKKMADLLAQTSRQTEELQHREKELSQINQELEGQTRALKDSEARLQVQQEELRQTNEELEEQTQRLEEQREGMEKKNEELRQAQEVIEEKAQALELSSRYKSEFLANMSHELRTPLNSILLLSKLMADNSDGQLSEDHVESAKAIYTSGSDLLSLINEVLDLSKVEAGKMELHLENTRLDDICRGMKQAFDPLAANKGLDFEIALETDIPQAIQTDRKRVEQILKNFLSNAFKFTETGSITLRAGRPPNDIDLAPYGLEHDRTISLAVVDTGYGIPPEKQQLIFEAFQQADGSTSRKFGGTGLGLSISREMARLLGGAITLASTPGNGSSFALHLPERSPIELPLPLQNASAPPAVGETTDPFDETHAMPQRPTEHNPMQPAPVADDRRTVTPEGRSLLVIEDDPGFQKVLRDLARENGFQCLIAEDGETGLQFAEYYTPSAIILDIGLPGINGWTVMTRLKENPSTRHIPVHFISASDRELDAMRMGAVDFLAKPVTSESLGTVFQKLKGVLDKKVKDLLVVEDDETQQKAIAKLIGNGDVRIAFAASAGEAYRKVQNGSYDCMVLDLGLPDMSGVDLLSQIRRQDDLARLPIVIYTGRELSQEELAIVDEYGASTIIKGVNSHQKLLDETTLFLHRIEADLGVEQRRALEIIHDKEAILSGKKVLVVDDDMRNVFSLKKILQDKEMEVLVGKNGREGVQRLKENPDLDLVLMDIMMPEMDGYEAMRTIRRETRFKDLPVIALTAKAMKGDRAKCIEAGASDYLPKPVDVDRLFSMLRVWLYR